MIVCPVCDHSQAEGGVCELCGNPLAAEAELAAGLAPLEGLEPTRHAATSAPEASPVDGLEPTAHTAAGAVTPPPLEIEQTRIAPQDVDAPALDGLERTAQQGTGDDDPTPLPVFVTCRYCRSPALPGERICGQCGMRLPVAPGASGEPASPGGRVCGCGALVRGSSCPSCGARPSP
ncbi:hypothetical protein [Anaeromyxobacter terrae]|uniref:hypothetical protein n=1 Tax=Anaeromyxobacter terrae TaxID=2925406 RepID=UPI001F5ABAE8|nr:hypothetical protein [Anaeromyxobacter sp. SG22]